MYQYIKTYFRGKTWQTKLQIMRKSQLLHLTKHIEGKQATRNCDVYLKCEASDNDSCYPKYQKLQEDYMGTSWELHAKLMVTLAL